MARIPLSLVTGFLGSGKTTFLQQTARRLADRRIVYLVNEFSSLDVDGTVLAAIGPNIVSVPGGSIFCKCLVGEFILHLREIPRRFHTADQPIAGVIVEASGISNPKVVADMLRETTLDALYELTSIVSVADPGSFRKLLVTLPNIRAQIEASDIVLLNKIDLFSEEQIAGTEIAMRQLNPRVRIVRTVRGAAEVELFGAAPTRDLHGEYAACADPHYARFSITLHNAVDLAKLQAALRDLAEDLYRVKGFVPTPQGTVYLDWSTAGLSIEAIDKPGVPPGLAIIARADSQQRVDQWLDAICGGALDPQE